MKLHRLALLAVLALAGSSACMAQSGHALFKQHCTRCHGQNAKGNTQIGKMLNVADLHSPSVQNKTDAQLKHIIRNGKGNMPAWKSKLNSKQINALVSYIRSLKKSKK